MCDQNHYEEDSQEYEALGLVTRKQFGILLGTGVAMMLPQVTNAVAVRESGVERDAEARLRVARVLRRRVEARLRARVDRRSKTRLRTRVDGRFEARLRTRIDHHARVGRRRRETRLRTRVVAGADGARAARGEKARHRGGDKEATTTKDGLAIIVFARVVARFVGRISRLFFHGRAR